VSHYEDRITITTPEGLDMAMTLAGVGSRFVAQSIDSTIQITVLIAAWIAFVGTNAAGGVGDALFALTFFLIFLAYDVAFEVLASGRTPGKRWSGLRVVRSGGQPVGFLTSCIRNILRLIDILPGFYLVGVVSILLTKRNQRVGDLAAGTIVVRARRGRPATVSDLPPRRTEPGSTWDVSAIGMEELAAVRSFLERRDKLTAAARAELGRTMAERLRPRVGGIPPESRLGSEAFLEQLVRAKAGS
jgi:uncharacterized RDD family membrane protein YckC